MNSLEYKLFYRRHLPHFQPPNATVFVPFRLHDSLPIAVQGRLLAEADAVASALEGIPEYQQRAERVDIERRRMYGRWDDALHEISDGSRWLRDDRVAHIVAEGLSYFDGSRCDSLAYCIMPNHVHWVLTPLVDNGERYHALADILHSVKRHTARRANMLLNRCGEFWQSESYDHVVRDGNELSRILQYVLNNPVKAGLVNRCEDWRWSYCRAGL